MRLRLDATVTDLIPLVKNIPKLHTEVAARLLKTIVVIE